MVLPCRVGTPIAKEAAMPCWDAGLGTDPLGRALEARGSTSENGAEIQTPCQSGTCRVN